MAKNDNISEITTFVMNCKNRAYALLTSLKTWTKTANSAHLCDQRAHQVAVLRKQIEDYLRQFSGTDILFYPNPGNAGDSMIAAATFEAFSRAGLGVKVIDLDSSVEGRVVFLGGGGNMVPLYDNMQKAIERFLGCASKLVLLPHTIRGHEQTIRKFDHTCTIFCRDPVSHHHIRSTNPSAEVLLAHDMAFHLDVGPLLEDHKLKEEAEPILLERLKGSKFQPASDSEAGKYEFLTT